MSAATKEALMAGSDLRVLREQQGITQYELAQELGYHETLISRLEKGLRPMPDGFAERFVEAVRAITRRRAEAVGFLCELAKP